jgi:hypothetical protein
LKGWRWYALSSFVRLVKLLSREVLGGLYFLWIKIGNLKGHKNGGVFFDVM